jgi:hypothetical protein
LFNLQVSLIDVTIRITHPGITTFVRLWSLDTLECAYTKKPYLEKQILLLRMVYVALQVRQIENLELITD